MGKRLVHQGGLTVVGKEHFQVCMLAFVFRVSVVEGKKSAKFCVRGIGHVRWGISVAIHDLVFIGDIISREAELLWVDWNRSELVAALRAAMYTSLGPGWIEAAKGCQGWGRTAGWYPW